MNEWFKKIIAQIRELWSRWKPMQKIIFFGIIGVAIIGLIVLVSVSASPAMAALFQTPVQDPALLDQIATRLDLENIDYTITADNRVMVADPREARQARTILVRYDLVPQEESPWEFLNIQQWTTTDFERNVNLQRAVTRQLEQHLESLEEIDDASVTLVIPERELFVEQQNPTTASVILSIAPGSDFRETRAKVEGVEKLIQYAVDGLQPENITITDRSGRQLNDFEGLQEFDRLAQNERILEIESDVESAYRNRILEDLADIFGSDRVRILNVDVTLDLSRRMTETEEFEPIVITPDNPDTPFSELETVPSITRSREEFSEQYRGSGFNPQGPPGVEAQVPPEYLDVDGLVGEYARTSDSVYNEINRTYSTREGGPEIRRVTASVAVDGIWRWVYTPEGEVSLNPDGSIEREYVAPTEEDLEKVRELVADAVGFSQVRGDSVTVRHIQFDRTDVHEEEDANLRRQRQIQTIVLAVLIGVAVILIAFIAFRLIARELERRRRLREEELSRQHQAMREAALRSAEEESTEVEMSVEERARLELQENAINMAREHPEDVAQLIRTWLMEE